MRGSTAGPPGRTWATTRIPADDVSTYTIIDAWRQSYVLERGIMGDFALVKAWKGDRYGNLVYRHTARNFNPLCAMAGRITVAEVEELVEVGELDPDHIHTPGVFVQRVVVGDGKHEKRIERRTTREK